MTKPCGLEAGPRRLRVAPARGRERSRAGEATSACSGGSVGQRRLRQNGTSQCSSGGCVATSTPSSGPLPGARAWNASGGCLGERTYASQEAVLLPGRADGGRPAPGWPVGARVVVSKSHKRAHGL